MKHLTKESACDEHESGIAVISLGSTYGSADDHALAELEGRILRVFDGSPDGLLVDFGETDYFGCGFLNVLLRVNIHAKENELRLAICTLNSRLGSLLTITRLDSFWEVFPTRRDAIKGMQKRTAAQSIAMSASVEQLCRKKGLSLLGLAEGSGLALRRLQSIYCGRWTPSPNEREKISDALNTPVDGIAWEHNSQVEHFYGPG